MQLHEANNRLKTPITEEQLDNVDMLYCLLEFMSKDDFCKIIDAVGIEKLVAGVDTYDRLFKGKKLLEAHARYESQKNELMCLNSDILELNTKRRELINTIEEYEDGLCEQMIEESYRKTPRRVFEN